MLKLLLMKYAVCEIAGRQYIVKPGEDLEVDRLDAEKNLVVDKVLLMVDKNKVEVGTPYLRTQIEFEVLGSFKGPKIRVASFHAKANYRRVIGSRRHLTKIRLAQESGLVKDQPSSQS